MFTQTVATTASHALALSRGRFSASAHAHAASFVNPSFMDNAGIWYPCEDTTVRTTKYHRPREASMT